LPPAISRTDAGELIALTTGEIRRLITAWTQPTRTPAHYLQWSHWRRRHQARARRFHYQRRLTNHMLRL
jgi:hypothetical protein